MLDAVAAAGMREYFHPETGTGLGAERLGWTAALALAEPSGWQPGEMGTASA